MKLYSTGPWPRCAVSSRRRRQSDELKDALADCLTAIRAGRDPEAAIAAHLEHAEALRQDVALSNAITAEPSLPPVRATRVSAC